MRKLFVASNLLLITTLAACSADEKGTINNENNLTANLQLQEQTIYNTMQQESEVLTVDEEVVEESSIDTSVFEYAKNIEVTDAREFTQHITVAIDLSPDADPGMGTLNVLKQTFDFLLQDDIAGAETITIYVRVNNIKVSQFKILTSKFVPNNEDPMAELVLKAAEIEHLSPEVEEFGKIMELW